MVGVLDFIGDAKAALWAADSALIVVDAANGVEIGTDKAWSFSEGYGRSILFFVNHMDKEMGDFDRALQTLQERYGRGAIPFQIPVDSGEGFHPIVDVLQRKLFTYTRDGSGKAEVSDVPPGLQGIVESAWEQIVEAGYSWPTRDVGTTSKFLFFGMSIDHIFARGLESPSGVEAVGAVQDNRGASDHRPVWALLVSPGEPAGDEE